MYLNARLARHLLPLALLGQMGCEALKPEALQRETSAVTAAGPTLLDKDALADALTRLRSEVGTDIKALELRITPNKLTLQTQSPTDAQRVVQYECTADRDSGPVVVELRGEGQLDENLFVLRDIALDGVPQLARTAVAQVDPEHGAVESVVVRRNLPFSSAVQMRVFVESPRLDGQVDADASATPLSEAPQDSD